MSAIIRYHRRMVVVRAVVGLIPALGGLFLSIHARAATTRAWNNANGGNWSTAANWLPSGVPGGGDSANILESGVSNIAINYDYTGSAVTLAELTVDDASAVLNATTALNISANTLSSVYKDIGYSGAGSNGSGTVNQIGGNNTVTAGLYVGYNPTDKGFYNLGSSSTTSGVLSAPSEYIGYGGQGNLELLKIANEPAMG